MTSPVTLRIRPYEISDVPDLVDAARESIATVGAWLWWCTPDFSPETARTWVASQIAAFRSNSEYEFAILSEEGRFLGGCGLNSIDARNARANLGYWVRESAAGSGAATQAVRQLVRWAFQNTDLVRLEILVAEGNHASLRVAEKVGAFREGLLRQRIRIQGELQDSILFSILRSDIRQG